MQENLRYGVRIYKAKSGKSYRTIADDLGINPHSFYNWLKGYYELGNDKEVMLREMLKRLEKEGECGNVSS